MDTLRNIEITFVNGETVSAYWSDIHLGPELVPEGARRYCVRHGDDDGAPARVEPYVVVNHLADIIITEPDMSDGERHIRDGMAVVEWWFTDEPELRIG